MAKRLTTFSKLLITLLIVAAVFFLAQWGCNNTQLGEMVKNQTEEAQSNSGNNSSTKSTAETTKSGKKGGLFGNKSNSTNNDDDDVIKIGVVTWGGYAGGQYFNEGFEANTRSRFFKEYGLKVEFKVLDDFEASRNAFRADEVHLLWQTIDAFPTEVNGLSDFDPVILWQADWSRGGDAIVARRGINKVSDLKGKKIAVAELTPSHSFLIWLLEAGGLTTKDVEIVPQPSAIDAAQVFKSQRVDAAVVWSPDDILAVKEVPGARVLENSKSAANIIADVFMAKREYVRKNEDRLRKLYEGWMRGAAEINSNKSNKTKAAKILAEEFTDRGVALTTEDALLMIDNVRLTTHGDNQNFFGLNPNFKGMDGEKLYTTMGDKYKDLGFIEGKVPNWRLIAYPGLVTSTSLQGGMHNAEAQKVYTAPTKADEKKEAVATKAVSISFPTAQYRLDENAKYIIDREFVDIAKAFGNMRIRVEGNTDNTGSYQANVLLSKKRAESVAEYLIQVHGFPRNRLVVVGNGPDKPVADNNTAAGKAKNRRTDFELIAG
jgi:NitT/TauT family transport system substrate-binding protein